MIYIIIPAYNEQNDIKKLMDQIVSTEFRTDFKLIAIDDGSTDKTFDLLAEYRSALPLEVIRHKSNLGLGMALKDGINYIFGSLVPSDIVVTLDADSTHDPALIPAIADQICENHDIVIASRFCDGGEQIGVPLYRKCLSEAARLLLNSVWPNVNIHDYTSGYRGYSGKILLSLHKEYGDDFLESRGFSATVELLLKAISISTNVFEIPLILRYDNKTGTSKMRMFETVIGYFITIFKLLLSQK
jgi:dolichol-phosphate mannosyltransferase